MCRASGTYAIIFRRTLEFAANINPKDFKTKKALDTVARAHLQVGRNAAKVLPGIVVRYDYHLMSENEARKIASTENDGARFHPYARRQSLLFASLMRNQGVNIKHGWSSPDKLKKFGEKGYAIEGLGHGLRVNQGDGEAKYGGCEIDFDFVMKKGSFSCLNKRRLCQF